MNTNAQALELALIAVCLQEGDQYVIEDEYLAEAARGEHALASEPWPGGFRLTLSQPTVAAASPFDVELEEPVLHTIDEPDEPDRTVTERREPRVVAARRGGGGLRARAWDTAEDLAWQDEVGAEGEQPDRYNNELGGGDGSVSATMKR